MTDASGENEAGPGNEADPVYSFVIPILDEVELLPDLKSRLQAVMDELDGTCEVIVIDDGSTDGSLELMGSIAAEDDRFRLVPFSRNFGHQSAITAGLDRARGQAVIIMDGDLQDPPEVAIEMAERWRAGAEVVFGVREGRDGERWAKRATASMFYRGLSKLSDIDIPLDTGDFRLVDREALDAVNSMREQGRYLRGMFAWVGYEQEPLEYERSARTAGETKFSLGKMLRLATDGVVSFSTAPLRVGLVLGLLVAAASFVFGLVAAGAWLSGAAVPGWTSLAVAIGFLSGTQLVVLGIIGAYLGDVHTEVKRRPLYVVRGERPDDPRSLR